MGERLGGGGPTGVADDRIPAARAASTPAGLSSATRQRAGRTPDARAACRNGSGGQAAVIVLVLASLVGLFVGSAIASRRQAARAALAADASDATPDQEPQPTS